MQDRVMDVFFVLCNWWETIMKQVHKNYKPCYFAKADLMPNFFHKKFNKKDWIYVFQNEKVEMYLDHVNLFIFGIFFFQ